MDEMTIEELRETLGNHIVEVNRQAKRIAELERGRDIQKGNAERWEALAMQYKREIERLRAIEKHARALLDGAGDEAVHHLKAALQERE